MNDITLAYASRPLMSNLTRTTAASVLGGGLTLGIAMWGRAHSDQPDPDGSSPGRVDRAEMKQMTSGPMAPTTLVPFVCVALAAGVLYTKGRILLNERGTTPPQGLVDAVRAAGSEIKRGEANLTKTAYAFAGGAFAGSLAAGPLIYGSDRYSVRHVPAGSGS